MVETSGGSRFECRETPKQPPKFDLTIDINSHIRTALLNFMQSDQFQIDSPTFRHGVLAPCDPRFGQLSTLGDADMELFVTVLLHEHAPMMQSKYIKVVRRQLLSNTTWVYIMWKSGCWIGPATANSGRDNKPVADAFETLVAAFRKDRGNGALYRWIRTSFWPLFDVVLQAWKEHPFSEKYPPLPGASAVPLTSKLTASWESEEEGPLPFVDRH